MTEEQANELILICHEMMDYVEQEVDPGWDLIEEWAKRVRAVSGINFT